MQICILKINTKAKDFGFIRCDDLSHDVCVAKDDINGALNNDDVLFANPIA